MKFVAALFAAARLFVLSVRPTEADGLSNAVAITVDMQTTA
jgi:hypothetical protein